MRSTQVFGALHRKLGGSNTTAKLACITKYAYLNVPSLNMAPCVNFFQAPRTFGEVLSKTEKAHPSFGKEGKILPNSVFTPFLSTTTPCYAIAQEYV